MARSFMDRCRYAREALLRNEDSRKADNCFEMYDGAMVVTMLMRWAQRDPALARAIVGEGPNLVEAWKKTAAAYSGLRSEDDIARTAAAIRAQQRQSDEREQSLYLSRLPATEPTPSGLQYTIPGCEKDRTRGPVQMDLF
jgi:membrane protein required for beta-lactamase induction